MSYLPPEVWRVIGSYLTIDDKIRMRIPPQRLQRDVDFPVPVVVVGKSAFESDRMEEKYVHLTYPRHRVLIGRKLYKNRKGKFNGKVGFDHFVIIDNPTGYLDVVHLPGTRLFFKLNHDPGSNKAVYRISDWTRSLTVYV